MSVQQLCLSPLTEGLFHRAVMSSGGGVSKMLKAAPAEKNYPFWQSVMEEAGCKGFAAFRALPPKDLFDAWEKAKQKNKKGMTAVFPCLDGDLIPRTGPEAVEAGAWRKIPYLIGITSEDVVPPVFFGMARKWCMAQEEIPAYCWFFDRQLPGNDNGAWHSSDLWYWFGTLENCWRPMTEKDIFLSGQMTDYLTNFVKTGNPNGENLPTWQPTTSRQKQVLRLGEREAEMGEVSRGKLVKTMLTNRAVGE